MEDQNLIYKRIGERIREVRQDKKMTQAQLANEANISLSHMSDIENGKKQMQLGTFIKITEVLQVSADAILRSNVPEVNLLYQQEFSQILADCSPSEIDAVCRIVQEIKNSFRQSPTE